MPTKTELLDILERSVWTFLQTFLGIFVVTDLATAEQAAVAGVAAVLAVIKGFVATKVGQHNAALPSPPQ